MELYFCTSCWLYSREQTNSSNKFAANLNIKGIRFFLLTLYNNHSDHAIEMHFNSHMELDLCFEFIS